MATADPTADAELEDCEGYREQREILSQCLSEVRQKLDERELELSLQLKNLFRENMKKTKIMSTDIQQLMNAMEQLKSTLSSNTLCETGFEAIEPIQKKIEKITKEEKTLLLNWSPQKLFHEIRNIGEYSLIPALEKDVTREVEILPETRTIPISLLISPPPFDQQRTEIHSLLQLPLQAGQSWYLIHIRWFKQWKRFVGYDNWDRASAGDEIAKPGPIDSIPLIERGRLRRDQVYEIDYKLVPEEAWHKLVSWYGTVEGSEIKRYVVPHGKFKQNKVEVYPLELKASVYPRVSGYTVVSLSRADTVQTLVRKVREAYNISSDKQTRIYNKHLPYAWGELNDLSQGVQDEGLFNGQHILLTIQNEDRSWPNP